MNEKWWSVKLGHGLGSLQLGQERPEILRRLEAQEIEVDADDEQQVFILDHDVILTFSETDRPVLIQIAIEDEQVTFGPEKVIGRPLHEIASLLQVHETETVWRKDDDPDDSLPYAPSKRLEPADDEELLDDGTLWIRPLGLGLHLWSGEIQEVLLRLPEHSPEAGIGQLTEKQLELSRRDDSSDHPTSTGHALQSTGQLRPQSGGCFRRLSGTVCFGLIAWVIWQGVLFQQRWNNAPSVEARVIVARPEGQDQIQTEFVVEYVDLHGGKHQAAVGIEDVLVRKQVGDTVELRYLPEQPDKPLGVTRASDAAFVKFFPWVIGVFGGYLVLQVAAAIVSGVLRTTHAATPNAG